MPDKINKHTLTVTVFLLAHKHRQTEVKARPEWGVDVYILRSEAEVLNCGYLLDG